MNSEGDKTCGLAFAQRPARVRSPTMQFQTRTSSWLVVVATPNCSMRARFLWCATAASYSLRRLLISSTSPRFILSLQNESGTRVLGADRQQRGGTAPAAGVWARVGRRSSPAVGSNRHSSSPFCAHIFCFPRLSLLHSAHWTATRARFVVRARSSARSLACCGRRLSFIVERRR